MLSCVTMPKNTTNRPVHHTDKGFKNLYVEIDKDLTDVVKMRFGDMKWVNPKAEAPLIPRRDPDLKTIHQPDPDKPLFTWIGHSTYLIQYKGITILTDPIFSERASPVSFAGPKRYTQPGVDITALPKIDAVIISHNHYDHLDVPSLEQLGPEVTYIVPLKNRPLLESAGLTKIHELDWHESVILDGGLKVSATPSQHWSARGLFDRRDALWAAFVFEWPTGYRVFFGGDTGYTQKLFTDIGDQYGPFQAALIPIGAYEPRWFMKAAHVNPQEAVAIHRDIRSEWSLGIHWGTFPLTAESPLDPVRQLELELQKSGISKSEFITLAIGETKVGPMKTNSTNEGLIIDTDNEAPSTSNSMEKP